MRASTTWRSKRRSKSRRTCRLASAIGCCSSARTCSRCSPSSAAAPTTRWRTCPRGRSPAGSSPPRPAIAVKARGAEVHLRGDTYDEAYAEARRLARSRKLAFVHPYDDPDVIAGQGTIGMEILRQATQPLDAVFVAVGGGGLISGIASYIKRLRPSVKVIGVEPVDADAMARSLKAGRRVVLDHVGLFADGV